MSSTTFVDGTTLIVASWLNDVNTAVYTTIPGLPPPGISVTNSAVVASTSGTAIDFTGIPSTAKRVVLQLNQVSTNGTGSILVQMGSSSGGIETSGYVGTGGFWGASALYTNLTAGFTDATQGATNIRTGVYEFYLVSTTTNTWICSSRGAFSDVAYNWGGGGIKSLTSTLDRIRITTVGGANTFDNGSVNISWIA